jgi:hypothetical protein
VNGGSKDAESTSSEPGEGEDGDGRHTKQEAPSLFLGKAHGTAVACRAGEICVAN